MAQWPGKTGRNFGDVVKKQAVTRSQHWRVYGSFSKEVFSLTILRIFRVITHDMKLHSETNTS